MINISSLANFLSINSQDIEDIESITNEKENVIFIKLKKKECLCSHCSSDSYKLKEYRNRDIKHALFIRKPTRFILKRRVYRCLSCGKTFVEPNPFAPTRSRVSFETIYKILEGAKEYNNTWKTIGKSAHVSDETAINIFDKYVNLPRGNLSRVICIDECHNKNQFQKPYSCIIFDFLKNKIIDIIEGRNKIIVGNYLSKISRNERCLVEYVVIDMWEPYLDVASIYFPHATVAIDSFHVIREIGLALDKVRKRIMSGTTKGTESYYLLKKWNSLLFSEQKPWEERQKIKGLGNKYFNRYELLNMMLEINKDLKIAREFYLKYQYLNEHTNIDNANEMVESFINYPNILDVDEFIPVVKMLSNWKEWIINSFNIVEGRRVSNGPIEGFNSNFKKMMTVSNGLYSFHRFRNRLMYSYNKLNCITPVKKRIIKRSRGQRGAYKKPRK